MMTNILLVVIPMAEKERGFSRSAVEELLNRPDKDLFHQTYGGNPTLIQQSLRFEKNGIKYFDCPNDLPEIFSSFVRLLTDKRSQYRYLITTIGNFACVYAIMRQLSGICGWIPEVRPAIQQLFVIRKEHFT